MARRGSISHRLLYVAGLLSLIYVVYWVSGVPSTVHVDDRRHEAMMRDKVQGNQVVEQGLPPEAAIESNVLRGSIKLEGNLQAALPKQDKASQQNKPQDIIGLLPLEDVGTDGDCSAIHQKSFADEKARSLNPSGPLTCKEDPVTKTEVCQRLPRAIIVGAEKCGSKALLLFLHQHPNVQMYFDGVGNYEVNYFNIFYRNTLRWYRNLMPFTSVKEITVEKSPRYFIDKCTPERIHVMDPSTKIIMLLRDPIERTVSDFVQKQHRRVTRTASDVSLEHTSFEQYILDPTTKQIRTSLRDIQMSVYAKYLPEWLKWFSPSSGQLLVLDGNKFREDPLPELKKVEDFLEIPPWFSKDVVYFNETKGFYCWRSQVTMRTECLGSDKGRPHPDIEPGVRQQLEDFFREHNANLRSMLGIDFSWM